MIDLKTDYEIIEHTAKAHCARAFQIGLTNTPWDALNHFGKFDALTCMEAALKDILSETLRLRSDLAASQAEVVRLRVALQAIIDCDDDHEVFGIFGLADSTDNDGQPFPSGHLTKVLEAARTALSHPSE